ncbi:MAG: PEP-CTERM sorting domain-containing protein [Gemmatimonadota bacterium]
MTQTPEPVSTTLMGLGLLSWAGAKARKRRQAAIETEDDEV